MTPANGPENRRGGSVPLEDMVDRIRDAHSTKPRETEEREYDPETGVVRVRKRRRVRKNNDLASRQRKMRRRVSMIVFGTIFVIVAIFAACYGMVWGTTKTDAFRKGFAESVMKQFGFQSVSSGRFSLNGSHLSTGKLEVEGAVGSLLQRAQLNGFEMELGLETFQGGDWNVRRCAATELKLFLVPPEENTVVNEHDLPNFMAAGFLLNDSPEQVLIDEFSFWKTTFIFGSDERKAESRVNQANIVFDRMVDGQGFLGHFGGAELEFKGWPALVVNKCSLRFQNGVLDVAKGSFNTRTGDLSFEGRIPSSGEGEFLVEAQNMRLAELIANPWLAFADGVISKGEFILKIDPKNPSARSLRGDLKLSTLRLLRIGFVQRIHSLLTRESSGETLFQDAGGTLNHTSEKTRIENLSIKSTEGVVIRGTLDFFPDESMKGMLMVGVPVDKFAETMPPIFKIGEGGLAWTPVVLTGTGASISDDLGERLATPPRESVESDFPSLGTPDTGAGRPAPGGAELFDALTVPESR